jgi:hypothetical protein
MYNLWYIQNFKDGRDSIRANLAFQTKDAAMSRYYTELAQVGVEAAGLASVVAMVYNDNAQIIASQREVSHSSENSTPVLPTV